MADCVSFVHFETEQKAQGAVSLHASGEKRPATSLTRSEWGNRSVVRLAGDPDRAKEVTDETRSVKRSGRPGAERVRILCGHPPRFEAPEAWSQERLLSWARDSVAWVEKGIKVKGSRAVIAGAYLHVDELRPHMHIELVPAMDDTKRPAEPARMSWKRLQGEWSGVKGKAGLGALQTSYWESVGQRYGMRRGEPSDRRREPTDDSEVLKTRCRLVEAQRDQARSRLSRERTGRLEAETVATSRVNRAERSERRSRRELQDKREDDRNQERARTWPTTRNI